MVVLLQSGKGASMGAAFGGAAQTMFGARGKASGIEKVTVYAAVIFMVLSVALASLSSQTRSSLDGEPAPEKGEAGLLPEPEKQGQEGEQAPVKAASPATDNQQEPAAGSDSAKAAPDPAKQPAASDSGADKPAAGQAPGTATSQNK